PPRQRRPGRGERVGEVGELEPWVVLQVGGEAGGLLGQRLLFFGGENQRQRTDGEGALAAAVLRGGARAGVPSGHGRLLQDQVGVGAGRPKRRDPGATGV